MSLTTVLTWVALGLVGLLVLFVVSLITALVYNEVAIGLLNGLFSIIGLPVAAALKFLDWIRSLLEQLTKWAYAGMVKDWQDAKSTKTSVGAVDEFTAAVLFVLLVIIFLADVAVAAVRIPELLGMRALPINQNLIAYLLVGYWVSSILGGVAMWADAWGITHFLPYYAMATNERRKILKIGTMVVVGLIVLGGLLQGVFQWEIVSGISLPFVDTLLNIVITLVGFLTLAELGIGVAYEFLGAFVLFPSLIRVVPTVIGWVLNIPLALLDAAASVVVSIYGMIARFGFGFWNWLSEISRKNNWRFPLSPMRPWERRPHIAERFKEYFITL